MKKFSFLALAAVGLLLGACTSDKDVVSDVQEVAAEEDGNQFIALNINLPSINSMATRNETVTDDNNYGDGTFELNDGLESEYTVNDATLIVFRAAATGGESAATYVAAYDINPEPWKESADHQVTDYSTKIVQKVGTTVEPNDLVLVILNRNGLFQFDSDGNLEIKGEGGTFADFSGTFGALQASLVTSAAAGTTAASAMTTNGFYMANAPLTDVAGSGTAEPAGATTQTLVKIENVYESEAAARAAEDIANVYVERGMAKVTVNGTITTSTLTTQYGEGTSAADINLTLDGWTLDQTNTKSYFVRSVEGHDDFIPLVNGDAKKYRYIGMSDITEGNPGDYKYRTYFAKDPNYEETSAPTAFGNALGGLTALTDVPAALSANFGETNPLYCFENTFDVAHQSVNNTTLVRLKVTAKTGTTAEDLYIVNGNKSTIYKEADVKTLIANKCIELIKASGVTTNATIATDDITVTLGERDDDGYKNITAIAADDADSKITAGTRPTDAELLAAVTALYKNNTVGKKDGAILCYAGGVSYYTIRVKHFGDQLTPWKKTGSSITPVPSLENGSYPGWDGDAAAKTACDANYLGRYGMLRNNWYDITVNSIKYLGEAVPTDYKNDPTPDDEIDGYIAVKINILSWAKRTQNWDL